MPSAFESWWNMVFDMMLFGMLAWYCDHVIEHNRGVAYPLHFMFTRQYWQKVIAKGNKGGGKKKKKKDDKKKKTSIDDYQDELNLET
jgi:hypothetical protein